jgi:hypothetical protein
MKIKGLLIWHITYVLFKMKIISESVALKIVNYFYPEVENYDNS